MKLTIDSSEPLEETLRVVGALYGVTLTVQPGAQVDLGAVRKNARSSPATGAAPRPTKTRKPARRTAKAVGGSGNAEIRQWARDAGYSVRDRGRIPASVTAAFYEARGSQRQT